MVVICFSGRFGWRGKIDASVISHQHWMISSLLSNGDVRFGSRSFLNSDRLWWILFFRSGPQLWLTCITVTLLWFDGSPLQLGLSNWTSMVVLWVEGLICNRSGQPIIAFAGPLVSLVLLSRLKLEPHHFGAPLAIQKNLLPIIVEGDSSCTIR